MWSALAEVCTPDSFLLVAICKYVYLIQPFTFITDTASVYRNESDIGSAVASLLTSHQLTRSDIFITSKLGTSSFCLSLCFL